MKSQFLNVSARRCSAGHVVWDVTWRSGELDQIHQGYWPNHLNLASRAELVATRSILWANEPATL